MEVNNLYLTQLKT